MMERNSARFRIGSCPTASKSWVVRLVLKLAYLS